jgi:hypothetical protein
MFLRGDAVIICAKAQMHLKTHLSAQRPGSAAIVTISNQ